MPHFKNIILVNFLRIKPGRVKDSIFTTLIGGNWMEKNQKGDTDKLLN